MRGKLPSALLVVLLTLVVTAGTSVAAFWTITPGGRFIGNGGPTEGPLPCEHSQITGQFTPNGVHLGYLDGLTNTDCLLFDIIAFEVGGWFPWWIDGTEHHAGVTTLRMDDIEGEFVGAGCHGWIGGWADATYVNGLNQLTLDQHVTVTSVDPIENCFGLVEPGESVYPMASSYTVTPPQNIQLL